MRQRTIPTGFKPSGWGVTAVHRHFFFDSKRSNLATTFFICTVYCTFSDLHSHPGFHCIPGKMLSQLNYHLHWGKLFHWQIYQNHIQLIISNLEDKLDVNNWWISCCNIRFMLALGYTGLVFQMFIGNIKAYRTAHILLPGLRKEMSFWNSVDEVANRISEVCNL